MLSNVIRRLVLPPLHSFPQFIHRLNESSCRTHGLRIATHEGSDWLTITDFTAAGIQMQKNQANGGVPPFIGGTVITDAAAKPTAAFGADSDDGLLTTACTIGLASGEISGLHFPAEVSQFLMRLWEPY